MLIKGILNGDLINYKKPAMVIEFPFCDFKCERECGEHVCQNSALATAANIDLSTNKIIWKYFKDEIAEAIILQGLEPFDSWEDVKDLISTFRKYTTDDIVIYTGYKEDECEDKISYLKQFNNIVIKFGRYLPHQPIHYDNILGVTLASPNQYAKKIS